MGHGSASLRGVCFEDCIVCVAYNLQLLQCDCNKHDQPPMTGLNLLREDMNITISSIGKHATLCALTLVSASALAQTYTVKIGGGYIDPRATSTDLRGTLPIGGGSSAAINLPAGNQLEVQPKSTLIFSVSRSFNDNWDAELVLGIPPKHDVKLHVGPIVKGLAAGGSPIGQRVVARDEVVVASVKQFAPTAFINYKFGDAASTLRPYVGIGVNYTKFKADATAQGEAVYNDGPVKIELTDSIGFAFQTGVSYKFAQKWSVNAGWSTAAVKNNMTISTAHGKQEASYRFHPSVFSLMVGYQY